jgi:hypothetical protein
MSFDDELLEQLILDGIVEFAGLDSNGDMLYGFSQDLKEKDPNLHRVMTELFMADVYHLWELGYVSMDATEENPTVRITEKALSDEELEKLPQHLKLIIEQIKDATRINDGD